MKIEKFIDIIGSDFYAGVPDSQLKALCDYLKNIYGTDSRHHIVAANEGNAVALAAGYHLATGKVPVVYMQNSGEGNIINPLASLLNERVYAIPCIFIIGWRGEPGVYDEPQHIYQGAVTCRLLEDMGVEYFIVRRDSTDDEVKKAMDNFNEKLSEGHDVAFLIQKEALSYESRTEYANGYGLVREDIIKKIVAASGDNLIISTTGKASRELFEAREVNGQGHEKDFLTIGSMGHASSIALGVALNKPDKRIWCIDGDGAMLMHMGAVAVIGSLKPANMIHVVINNGAHESVGGMYTAAKEIDTAKIAQACGYPIVLSVENLQQLELALDHVKNMKQLCFIEIKCSIVSRSSLGRPVTAALDNKQKFMDYINAGEREAGKICYGHI